MPTQAETDAAAEATLDADTRIWQLTCFWCGAPRWGKAQTALEWAATHQCVAVEGGNAFAVDVA